MVTKEDENVHRQRERGKRLTREYHPLLLVKARLIKSSLVEILAILKTQLHLSKLDTFDYASKSVTFCTILNLV